MSLRRRSCDPCFKGRRKCDLAYPSCQRCERTGKSCRYVGEPILTEAQSDTTSIPATTIAEDSYDDRLMDWYNQRLVVNADLQNTNFDFAIQTFESHVSNLVGELGDSVQSQISSESWRWALHELREFPAQFAKTGANMFIHESMYRVQSPRAMQAAFGICAASQMVVQATRAIFLSYVDSEASMLLNNVEVDNIREGLARLQAMTLYQIVRLLSKDPIQQKQAEQQKTAINAWALRLLQRTQTSVTGSQTYENVILVESIRRTVCVIYLVHALNSISRLGVCVEIAALAVLPISINSDLWESIDTGNTYSAENNVDTMKYGEWTDMWITLRPRRKLNAFQKIMMVVCKGKAKVEELETENV